MLNQVKQALVAAGVISAGEAITFNASISTGDGISFELDCGRRGRFHAKVSRYGSLREQFEAYRLAHARFPAFVPEPLGYSRLEELDVLIARFVECQPLRRGELALDHWQQQLSEFFGAGRATATGFSAERLSRFKAQLEDYFTSLDGADSPRCRYLREVQGAFEASLPSIPQHGDLAINNLGRCGDKLVVFDWEDYGAVEIAGLDICLLALSISRMDPDAVRQLRDSPDPAGRPWAFARPACDAIGLDYREFRRLVPLYVLAFRYLKRNYTSSIRDVSDRLFDAALS